MTAVPVRPGRPGLQDVAVRPGDPRVRPIGWVSSRSLMLHAALLVAVPLCGVAAWWQVGRALSGNELSWLYVFEWPAFAGLSVWLWWVLLTSPCRDSRQLGSPSVGRPAMAAPAAGATSDPDPPAATGDTLLAARRATPTWSPATETGAWRDYNRRLEELNAGRISLSGFRRRRVSGRA